MARGENIGKAKIGIEPDFDQAALFRQVRAASEKIPALNLPVKITAKSVNAAVREVNQKKLAALDLPVKISAQSVRTAVREYNARPGNKPAILVDVKFNKSQIKKALKEAYDGASIVAAVKQTGDKVVKEEEKTAKKRKNIVTSLGHWRVDTEKMTAQELKTLWANNERFFKNNDKERQRMIQAAIAYRKNQVRAEKKASDDEIKEQRRVMNAALGFRKIQVKAEKLALAQEDKERLRVANAAIAYRKQVVKAQEKEAKVQAALTKKTLDEEDKERMRAMKAAITYRKNVIKWERKAAEESAKAVKKVDRSSRGGKGIGQFAANIVILRSAFSLVRLSAIGTFFGFIAQGAAAATSAVTALTSAVGVGLTGALITAGTGVTALAQGMGVWKFAMQGVKEAIGGTNGLNESLNKALKTEAFEGLTPSTKEFVKEMEKLKPLARGLQTELQEGLFKGILESLRIVKLLLNDFVGPLKQTSEVMGDLSIYAAQTAKIMSRDLMRAMAGNNLILRAMGESGVDLVAALIDILVTAQPMVLVFARGLRVFAASTRSFIASAQASGELAEFMKLAGTNMRIMLSMAQSLGRILISTFRAALPFGMMLLLQLDGVFERLAKFTSSPKGQKALKDFFAGAMPAIHEFGLLVRDIGIEFTKLASQPGLAIVLKTIREDLVPALGEMIAKVTRDFGPVLVTTLVQLAGLMATMVGQAGPLNNLVRAVGVLAETLDTLLQNNPQLLKFVTIFFLLESALSVLAVQRFLFQMSGLGAVIGKVTTALWGTVGLGPTLKAVGAQLRTGAGFLKFAGWVGIAIAAIDLLVNMFGQLFLRLSQGESFGSAFANAFSFAVIGVLIDTVEAVDMVIEKLGEFGGMLAKLPGSAGTIGKILESSAGAIDTGVLDKLTAKLQKWQDVVRAPTSMQGAVLGPEAPGGATSDFEKQYAAMQKRISKMLAQSQAEVGGSLKEIGINFDGTKEKTAAATEANKAHSRAMAGIRAQTIGAREALDGFGQVVERQKTLVDALAGALDELRNIQLEGTKAFSDAKFAIDQESKALELQQVQLKLAGASDEDPRLKELQKQLDVLGLKAQEVDLNESLQLDPLRKTWDETINPIKELSFDTAMAAFKGLTAEHQIQTVKLQKLESQYKMTEERIQSTERAAQKLSATFRSQIGTMPATALDGGAAAGSALLAGLESGARGKMGPGTSLHKFLKEEIPTYIEQNKGPLSYDQTILVPAGEAIMTGLETGLRRGFEPVKGYLRKVGPELGEYVPDDVFAKRTAEYMVEVAQGKSPDPKAFFADLQPDLATLPLVGGPNPFNVVERMFNLTRSSGDSDAAGSHATGSYHFRPAPWGGVQAYDYGDASNSQKSLKGVMSFAYEHADMFAEAFFDRMPAYIKNGQIIRGIFGGHDDHVHLAFRKAFPILGAMLAALRNPGIPAILKMIRFAAQAFGANAALLTTIARRESSFDPTAINLWDSNAAAGHPSQGIFQFIPATFMAFARKSKKANPAAWKGVPMDIRNPMAQALAAAWAFTHGQAGHWTTATGISPSAWFGGFRAMGGPTMGGKSYIVGENGPELWTERRNGHIMNNKDLMKMVNLLEEIRDTGGLRQQTTNIQTASQSPAVVAEMIERKRRRKLSRLS